MLRNTYLFLFIVTLTAPFVVRTAQARQAEEPGSIQETYRAVADELIDAALADRLVQKA